MSDRGDVTIELYVQRDKIDDVLAAIGGATNDDVTAADFATIGENEIVFAETEWLDVQNNEGNTDTWVERIVEIDGLAGLEVRNSLSPGVETWRWTPALGTWRGTLSYDQGDVISIDQVLAAFSQAASEEATIQLEAAWRVIAEAVGYKWIKALQDLHAVTHYHAEA